MKRSDFYYDLPEELIAQTPLSDRSASRMMTLDRHSGAVRHDMFRNFPDYLQPGDCIVVNNTKVIPARLIGQCRGGSAAEILLLRRLDINHWETIVRPGKKLRPGDTAVFGKELKALVTEIREDGNRVVEFSYDGVFEDILDRLGEMPLPPYIKEKLGDASRYQTVYAKHEGSAAAPTAGLHFTDEIFRRVKERGVSIAELTLHVGLGTFRPVKADDLSGHVMHSEFYSIDEDNCALINAAKQNGNRVVAIGTTSCRTLESVAGSDGLLRPASGETGIFIFPGYKFKCVDALLTNFHLPESTLLMLISALAGRENVLAAYAEAVRERYRFFSFGDVTFIGDTV